MKKTTTTLIEHTVGEVKFEIYERDGIVLEVKIYEPGARGPIILHGATVDALVELVKSVHEAGGN